MSPDNFPLYEPPLPAEGTEIFLSSDGVNHELEEVIVPGPVEIAIQRDGGDPLAERQTQPPPEDSDPPQNVTQLFPGRISTINLEHFNDGGQLDSVVADLQRRKAA